MRKLWNCIEALPDDCPLHNAVANDRMKADAKAEADSIDDTLAMFKRG